MKWSDILTEDIMTKGDILAERAMQERNAGKTIFPPQDQIFRALSITTPDKMKVCIIGQDPYHGHRQANGLAFSVSKDVSAPPSLVNIFTELCNDIGCPAPTTGDLTPWAEQGVLLLNTSLTVEAHRPNSHSDWGWQEFTHAVLKQAACLPQPIVFILWGANACQLTNNLDVPQNVWDNKLILKSTHPSPYSAAKASRSAPAFFGSRPFSKTNDFLRRMGVEPINWTLS